MTYLKNTEQVRAFKKELVRQFFAIRRCPKMEVAIKGDAKEIAALVLEIQRQQASKKASGSTSSVKSSSEEFYRRHGITHSFA